MIVFVLSSGCELTISVQSVVDTVPVKLIFVYNKHPHLTRLDLPYQVSFGIFMASG